MTTEFINTSDQMPTDGQVVEATGLYRFQHYKKGSQQERGGFVGRWQEHNGYGWSNCDGAIIAWRPATRGGK